MTTKLTIAAVCGAALLLARPNASEAGYTYESAYCTTNSDGSGYCQGTFLGFRNAPGAYDYAQFQNNTTPGYVPKIFYASYLGKLYACIPDGDIAAIWPMAMATRGYFNLVWDASGTCHNLWLNNGSYTQNF